MNDRIPTAHESKVEKRVLNVLMCHVTRVILQQCFQSGVNLSDVVMRTSERGKYLDSKNLGHSPQVRETKS